jgi:hypothetical protein
MMPLIRFVCCNNVLVCAVLCCRCVQVLYRMCSLLNSMECFLPIECVLFCAVLRCRCVQVVKGKIIHIL